MHALALLTINVDVTHCPIVAYFEKKRSNSQFLVRYKTYVPENHQTQGSPTAVWQCLNTTIIYQCMCNVMCL